MIIGQTHLYSRWQPPNQNLGGAIVQLNSLMARVGREYPHQLPDLRSSDAILILSDFGGEHRSSSYETYSFLLVDPWSFGDWDRRWQGFRSRHLRDGRRVSFKGLNDKHKRAALPAYFRAAEHLNGILFTMLFRKNIGSFFERDAAVEPGEQFPAWKPAILEKVLRAVHLVSFLVAGLSGPDQDIHWYTDDDAIAPSLARLYDVCEIYKRVSSHYIQHPMRHFRFGTSQTDDGSLRLEDLLALPDLAAGALADLFTTHLRYGPRLGQVACAPNKNVQPKTQLVMNWLSDERGRLKKLVLLTETAENSTGLDFKRIKLWGSRNVFIAPLGPA